MSELIIEVKDGKACLATWREEMDGIRIERHTAPNVSTEDLEETILKAGGSLALCGTYPVTTKILRKVSPIRKEGQPKNLDKKTFLRLDLKECMSR
jgi:hypothetical protein